MKEEIVSFETAKLAKEKGFDIPCHSFYDLYNNPNNRDLSHSIKDNWNVYKSYSAPTQSLVQRWLREKHNIFLTSECNGKGKYMYHGYDADISKPCGVTIENQVDESGCFEFGSDYCFNTPEEAIEEGLIKVMRAMN